MPEKLIMGVNREGQERMAVLVVRPNSRDQFVNELNHLQVEVMPCLLLPCSTSNSLPSLS